MTRLLVVCCFSLLLAGVFGADVTVKVMNGDSVTLLTNPDDIKEAESLSWKFNDKNIATIDLEVKNSQAEYPDEEIQKFRGRLNLDRKTGSLNISNLRTNDIGEYQLINKNGTKIKHKTFSVTFNDEPNRFSVIKGDPVTLKTTGVKIQSPGLKWKFNGNIIPDLTHSTITNMKVNSESAELNISDIKLNQSGQYEVEINGRDVILHRIFNVSVNEEESVSQTKGEFVILPTFTTLEPQSDDVIEWKFKNTVIAQFNRTAYKFPYTDAERRDRLHMDIFGSLIIMKLKTEDSGPYDVNINNSKNIVHKRFSLNVTESSSRSHQVGPGLFVVVILLVIAMV